MTKTKNNIRANDLDLHGIKHQDVEVLVEEHVLLNTPPMRIITGHSTTMKKIVKTVLERHKYSYDASEATGWITVLSE